MYRSVILALIITGWMMPSRAFSQGSDLYDPANYPFYYNALYADLFWRCKTTDVRGVGLEGYAVSSRGEPIAKFQVRLIARDPKGKQLSDRAAYGKSQSAHLSAPIPFAIAVPTGGETVRHDLLYSFEVPSEDRTSRRQFGTAEDACGGRWRRQAK